MERLSNWDDRLAKFISERRNQVFEYGVNDCAMFASDAVIAVTGVDPAPDFRGKYSTKAQSIKALRKIGDGDLEATFSARFEERPKAFAQRGDLVFDGEAVGVCLGRVAAFVGTDGESDGLGLVPMSEMLKVWAV